MNYITFDIETYYPEGSNENKIDPKIMRLAVAGAYLSWRDLYIAFFEEDIRDLLNLMAKADLIVGYNQIGFDLPVLQKYTDIDLLALPNYDLLLEVEKGLGYKVKLDDLAKINLNTQKTDSYENYRHYYKQGKFAELTDYCMHDVKITEELFRLVQNQGKLLYQDYIQTKEILLEVPKQDKKTTYKNLVRQDSIF